VHVYPLLLVACCCYCSYSYCCCCCCYYYCYCCYHCLLIAGRRVPLARLQLDVPRRWGAATAGGGAVDLGRHEELRAVDGQLDNRAKLLVCVDGRQRPAVVLAAVEGRQLLKLVAPVGHPLLPLVAPRLLRPLALGVHDVQQDRAVGAPLHANLPVVLPVVDRPKDLVEVVAVRQDVRVGGAHALVGEGGDDVAERRGLVWVVRFRNVALKPHVKRRWQPRRPVGAETALVEADPPRGVAREVGDLARLAKLWEALAHVRSGRV